MGLAAPGSVPTAATEGVVTRPFLDRDGALADFDAYATALLGAPSREFHARRGAGRFWARITGHEGFVERLPLLPDARELRYAV